MADLRKLIDAVAPAGLDGAELAEALWLAKAISDGAAAPPAGSGPTPGGPRPPPAPGPDLFSIPPIQGPDIPVTPYRPAEADARGFGSMGVPRMPALAHAPALLSELRPFARRTPSPKDRVFDEAETVERTAATGVPWPVTRTGSLRDRELCLVLDRDAAMAAWEGLAGEVRGLFEAVGGFRRISVWYSESDLEGRLRLAERADAPATEPLSRLRDPSGHRIVVLLTTALGDAWALGTAAADLNLLAETGAVAVAQPLPSALWRRTGLDLAYGRIAPRNPGRPGVLRVLDAQGEGAAPIPVLELARGWLAPWARTLAGDGSPARYPLLRLGHGEKLPYAAPEERRPTRPRTMRERQRMELDADAGPEELVRRFRSASSADAYRLAVLLSVVGLNPPVMRLIRQAVMPASSPSVLAEVIAGGLLEPAAPRRPFGEDEDRSTFVFRGGVGEVLRRALRRSESMEVLALTTGFMEVRYDVPGRLFRGTLSQPSAEAGGLPFAYVSAETLQRVAPNFRFVADSLDPADLELFAGTAPVVVRSGDASMISESVARGRRLLAALGEDDAKRAEVLDGMIELLYQRWRLRDTDDPADLDEAIALAKASLMETGEDEPRARRLARLGGLLRERSRPEGTADHFIEAARVLRSALATAPPSLADQERAGWLEDLGDVSRSLGRKLGEPLYCTEAYDLYSEAARLTAEPGDYARLTVKCVHARLDLAELTGALGQAAFNEVAKNVNSLINTREAVRRPDAVAELEPILERVTGLDIAPGIRDRLSAYLGQAMLNAANGAAASDGEEPGERQERQR